MTHKDFAKSPSKFISPKHIAHSENITFEILRQQEEDQYHLENIIKMQVSNLPLALQIYHTSKIEEKIFSGIFSLDKRDNILKEIEKEANHKIPIQTSNNTKEILDLRVLITELASLLSDEKKDKKDIDNLFNQIKNHLNSYKKQDDMIFDSLNDYNFSHTKDTFNKAKETIEKIYSLLDNNAKKAQEDFKNRFNKDMIILSANIIGKTHLPIITHILYYKLGKSMAKKMLLSIFGGVAGLAIITVSMILLLEQIYDFFSSKNKHNQKIQSAYKVYGAIISIYETLNYSLASLLNFNHIGDGNLITAQKDSFFAYSLYPSYNKLHSSFLYSFLKDNVFNFSDISYKATLSLNVKKEQNQTYIENIFEKNNKNDGNHIDSRKITQFSTFTLEHLYKIYAKDKDNNFTHSSAFCHLHNMLLEFDNFLFIKSSSFSSMLANDLLIQSFTPSKQHNKPSINKTALFLTNCLHNGLPEYEAQKHIKSLLYENNNTKTNVLFLSAMYRVKKIDFVTNLIDKLIDLLKGLDNNLTTELNDLIKQYNIKGGASNAIDDKKLCNINENAFCNFIYDLCQMFISKKHIEIYDTLKDASKKASIKQIYKEMMAIILDVSQIFSHFNAYEIAKFREYEKDIKKEYEKQKEIIENFFAIKSFKNNKNKEEPNIFYNKEDIKKLCLALFGKYFNINNSDKYLESLLKENIEYSPAEKSLLTNNKVAYYQITIEYIIPLLPLNKLFLNCLEEEDAFLFTRLIIEALRGNNDFFEHYEKIIELYALINSNDKDLKKIFNTNTTQDIINAFYEISLDTSKKILEDALLQYEIKEIYAKYGITAVALKAPKDIIKDIVSKIAQTLDEIYTQQDAIIPKKFSIFSAFINSAISSIAKIILDAIFPTQINTVMEMKQQALVLLFTLNRHRNTPYATCKKGSAYLTFPIEITQTLINADIKALIIGGSALDSGLFVKNPSVALFNEDSHNGLKTLKETLRHFMNHHIDLMGVGERGKSIVKEAYSKLWYYLDMGKNEEIDCYLRHKIETKPRYYTLENLNSDKYISTKLKKSKELDNSDKNFIKVEGNATGGIRFNRDFLIQLKRVAEYNYAVYRGLIDTETNDGMDNKDYEILSNDIEEEKADKNFDKYLCGNLIYDEDYIPTTIDIVDKKDEK